MPEIEGVRKKAILGGGGNIILVLLLTTVSFLLWRRHHSAVLVAPVKLSTRAPAQPANHSPGPVYYISPPHLYASFHVTD